jgi:hypothetical protein
VTNNILKFHGIKISARRERPAASGAALVLDLPSAGEAIVPQRSQPWPPRARSDG